MPKHFWSVKFTCCWIIERSKTNQLMRSKNFRKCLWKPIRIRTSFGSLKIRKPSRPSEGNEIWPIYFTETLNYGRMSYRIHLIRFVCNCYDDKLIFFFENFFAVCWIKRSCINSSSLHWEIFVRKHQRRQRHLYHHLKAVSKMKNCDKSWTTSELNVVCSIELYCSLNATLHFHFLIWNLKYIDSAVEIQCLSFATMFPSSLFSTHRNWGSGNDNNRDHAFLRIDFSWCTHEEPILFLDYCSYWLNCIGSGSQYNMGPFNLAFADGIQFHTNLELRRKSISAQFKSGISKILRLCEK